MDTTALERVRALCQRYPETIEKISHGEPTFFAKKKVFVMFAGNEYKTEPVSVWVPAPAGLQEELIDAEPDTFYKPPYVGPRGWIGIRLEHINDEGLAHYIHQAWLMVAPKTLIKTFEQA